MHVVLYSLAAIALFIPTTERQPVQSPIAPTLELVQGQKAVDPLVPVALPVNAKVWLKAEGATTGKVTSFNAQTKVLTLGKESIQLAKISKIEFDRKALVYQSNGKLIIRGEDNAQAKQSTWANVALSAFQLKDAQLGQAQINLAGVLKPIQLKAIQSVAKNSMYVVDEIQFQTTGKMTIKVTASDR